MEVTTKYSVGDKVYLVNKGGLMNDRIRVELHEIKSINIGTKNWERYDFGTPYGSRGEDSIHTTIETARKAALAQLQEQYDANVITINGDNPGDVYIQ